MTDLSRRRFVVGTGAAIAVSGLAGCSDGGNGGGNGDGGNGGGDVPQEIDEYLSNANGYDGSLADHTGEDEVTVEVGTGDIGYGFTPAAIRIDSETTVTWEWTGKGSSHDVVHEGGDFQSDRQREEGATFEYVFEAADSYRYYCNPHKMSGMKGGVVVDG